MSVLLAALMWFVIMNVEDPVVTETFYNIPVKVTNEEVVTSKGYQYSIESGETIDIKVEGKRSIVDNISDTDLRAVADFSTMSNIYLVNIEASCPKYDEGELILTARTETMSIKLEDSETQSFGLRIIHEGEVREGYKAFDSSATSLIQVTGAASQVAKVKEVVVYIDVDGRKESFEVEETPVAIDTDGNAIDPMKLSFSQDQVSVKVDILPTKEVALDVVAKGNPAQGFAVTGVDFAPSTVTIAGEQADLDRIEKISVACDITDMDKTVEQSYDLSELLKEKFADTYHAIDDNVTIAAVVDIVKLERVSVEITASDIDFRNLANGLAVSLYGSERVTVGVYVTPELKESITASDLHLYADVATLDEGTHSVKLGAATDSSIVLEETNLMVSLEPTA